MSIELKKKVSQHVPNSVINQQLIDTEQWRQVHVAKPRTNSAGHALNDRVRHGKKSRT